jgi:hypothetical protein
MDAMFPTCLRAGSLALLTLLLMPVAALAAWLPNGNPVAAGLSVRSAPVPVDDSHGGVFVSWQEGGSVLAQRFAPDGEFAMGWPATGVRISPPPIWLAFTFASLPDGYGGLYVLTSGGYCGPHCTGDPVHLYLYRLTAEGTVAPGWPAGGLLIESGFVPDRWLSGAQMIASARGAIVAWRSEEYDPTEQPYVQRIYAQSIGADGSLRWGKNGVRIAGEAGTVGLTTLASDDDGGALVFWPEATGGRTRVEVQHLSSEGAPLWGAAGVPVSPSGMTQMVEMHAVSCGPHAVTVAWLGGTPDAPEIRALRFDSRRGPSTERELLLAPARAERSRLRLAATTDGGAIAAWLEASGDAWGVRAQRISPDGQLARSSASVWVSPPLGQHRELGLASDGRNGAYLAWDATAEDGIVYATHLGPNGAPTHGWPARGASLCARRDATGMPYVYSVSVAEIGDGDAIAAWDVEFPEPRGGYGADEALVTRLTPSGPVVPAGPNPTIGEMPAGSHTLALDVPPAAAGEAFASVTLAGPQPASLELFDVAGRRVWAREVGALGAGGHHVSLGSAPRGLYLLRLRQGDRVETRRVYLAR